MMRNGSGVYVIRSTKRYGSCYVGSSTDLNARLNKHFWGLRHHKHDNSLLQEAYDKQDLEFRILIYCEEFELLRYEQFFIDHLNSVYNQSPTAGSCKGCNHIKKRTRPKPRNKKIHLDLSICHQCKESFIPRSNGSTWFYCKKCMDYFDRQPEIKIEYEEDKVISKPDKKKLVLQSPRLKVSSQFDREDRAIELCALLVRYYDDGEDCMDEIKAFYRKMGRHV